MAVVATVVIFGTLAAAWTSLLAGGGSPDFGMDLVLYRDATERWLAGQGFYLDHQLAGPYVITHGDVLYPPPILLLLIPFTVLPTALWWVIPISITVAIVVWHRPTPIAWLLIALCLAYPITGARIWHGNPGLWFMAAIALGTRYGWPSVLLIVKPTLLPFAIIGANRRSWWLALAGLVAVSLAFVSMWPDFVSAMSNSRSDLGLLYSASEVPLALIPVIAWLGGRRADPLGPWLGRNAGTTGVAP